MSDEDQQCQYCNKMQSDHEWQELCNVQSVNRKIMYHSFEFIKALEILDQMKIKMPIQLMQMFSNPFIPSYYNSYNSDEGYLIEYKTAANDDLIQFMFVIEKSYLQPTNLYVDYYQNNKPIKVEIIQKEKNGDVVLRMNSENHDNYLIVSFMELYGQQSVYALYKESEYKTQDIHDIQIIVDTYNNFKSKKEQTFRCFKNIVEFYDIIVPQLHYVNNCSAEQFIKKCFIDIKTLSTIWHKMSQRKSAESPIDDNFLLKLNKLSMKEEVTQQIQKNIKTYEQKLDDNEIQEEICETAFSNNIFENQTSPIYEKYVQKCGDKCCDKMENIEEEEED